MSYGYFSKYDREVVRVFQIREHHAQIVKLGRYAVMEIELDFSTEEWNTYIATLDILNSDISKYSFISKNIVCTNFLFSFTLKLLSSQTTDIYISNY